MQPPSKMKREFMEKWIKGLQVCSKTREKMNFNERKNAIKLSADIAMASTRISSTSCWSHAILRNASNKNLVEEMIGNAHNLSNKKRKRIRCKKILRRSCCKYTTKRGVKNANSIAKRMVKKRTEMLKSLVPGGKSMDDVSLIKETLDYVMSLRIQVDVMKQLADQATGFFHQHQGHHIII